jgi:hypothetical protein
MNGSASAERAQSLKEQSLNKAEGGRLIFRPTQKTKDPLDEYTAQRRLRSGQSFRAGRVSRCEGPMNVKLRPPLLMKMVRHA